MKLCLDQDTEEVVVELSLLLDGIDVVSISGEMKEPVSEICYDSRSCVEDALFVSIPGLKFDGHDYIDAAIQKGARYIVHEKDISRRRDITYIKVGDSRRTLGKLGKNFFRNPTAELCLIGVTGTNGKTTVTYLLESILKAAGFQVGVIGTINYRFCDESHESSITTPESIDLQRIFKQMLDAGVTHVIAEVSSHALDLARVDDCDHDMGIFTNLSQDHLDYHHTLENYYQAKKRFFLEILKDGKKMIINADDPWGQRMIQEMGIRTITFGINNKSDVSVGIFDLSLDGIRAEIRTDQGTFAIKTPMIGKFNLYNILASAAVASRLNISQQVIKEGIESMHSVPGRFQKVSSESDPAVFVDYAHTDDALRNVLENLSHFKKKNIITVFGCGGDRDRGKRPLMGKAASELSDFTIITSDNPRTEDPLEIIGQIEAGITNNSIKKYAPEDINGVIGEKGYVMIPDRREAIHMAVSIAEPLDIILIAGKGHEHYQIIGDKKFPFDDAVVAREALRKRKTERTG